LKKKSGCEIEEEKQWPMRLYYRIVSFLALYLLDYIGILIVNLNKCFAFFTIWLFMPKLSWGFAISERTGPARHFCAVRSPRTVRAGSDLPAGTLFVAEAGNHCLLEIDAHCLFLDILSQ
jgi:hypothetical protein